MNISSYLFFIDQLKTCLKRLLPETSGLQLQQVEITEEALQYCQLIERMEELVKKKDEGKKRSRRRRVDNAVLCRRFCCGDLIPGLEAGL
jgi:hypothetical protein